MPERYSDEHLRLLQQGIPVYPGDEALIAQIAGQARTDAGRYKPWRGAIAGDPMGGNVTPRFGMDTARQGRVNLGLPKAKRKVVKTVSADPAVADKVITTVEDEVPSNVPFPLSMIPSAQAATTTIAKDEARPNMGAQWTGKDYGQWDQFLRSEPPRIPGRLEQFVDDPIGSIIGTQEYKTYSPEADIDYPRQYGPRWVDRSDDPHPFWGEGNLPRIITSPVKAISKAISSTADVTGNVLEDVGKGIASLGMTQAEYDKANRDPSAGVEEDTTTPSTTLRVDAGPKHLPSTYQQGDPVARIYGDWARDIPTERKEYLRAMKDIYFKMSMLSAVASLTGGEDQSEGFGRMQVEMLNYMMETDNQDRLLKIHKGVYFNKDGKWDPPKNERMAHQRAVRFGAGPEEASEFSGHYPKTEGIWQNWMVKDAEGNEFIKASKGGPPPGYPEFRLAPAGVGLGVERFRVFELQFNAATSKNGRMSVARRYARSLKEKASRGMMFQPPTDGEIQAAYNELRGDVEPTDIKKEG